MPRSIDLPISGWVRQIEEQWRHFCAVDLRLDSVFGEGYSSKSQWARRVTEAWAAGNLYCVACPSDHIQAHGPNMKVEDYRCEQCQRRLQLKAKGGKIGASVANSAFETKMAAIRANRAPDYGFLRYDKDALAVTDLFIVPGHFMTESVVSRRAPLRATARRAGWVGSNIHLNRIPESGKIAVVQESRILSQAAVRASFRATAFLQTLDWRQRGWVADVLACVDRLGLQAGDEFRLEDIYRFEGKLQAAHPNNNNVKPKIRQQLQVLRDKGVIAFAGAGRYVKV